MTASATSSAQIGSKVALPEPDTGTAGRRENRSSSVSHGSPGV